MDRTNEAQPAEQWVGWFLYLYGVCMDGLRKTKRRPVIGPRPETRKSANTMHGC